MATERLTVMVQRAVQKYVAAQQAKPLGYLHLEPKPPATWPMPRPAHRPAPMKPETAALIGGLADAASTYTMLKRGWGVEGNPLYRPLQNRPFATGLSVAGIALVNRALRSFLRKRFPDVADALAANEGARQLGLAALNLRSPIRESSVDLYEEALARYRRQQK